MRRISWLVGLCCVWLITSAQTCKPTVPFLRAGVPLLKPEVLFDHGHGQKFSVDESGPLDLSTLAAIIERENVSVKTTGEPLTEKALSGTDALVISGPMSALAPEEIDAVVNFVEDGGKLCLLVHIPWPLAPLLKRLGVAVSSGVVQEQENVIEGRPLSFRVIRLEPHEITKDLHDFTVFGTWAFLPRGDEAMIIARTSPSAWIDVDGDGRLGAGDSRRSFAVAVAGERGKGGFVVFGDDEVFQNRYLVSNNRPLTKKLAAWLAD